MPAFLSKRPMSRISRALGVCLIAGLCAQISGCVSVPKSADAMKTNNQARRETCSQKTSTEVARYLKEKFESCKEASFSAGPLMNTDSWVETSTLEDGTYRISLVEKANWNKYHKQLVEISKTKTCPAQVVVYGMNDNKAWFGQSEEVIHWVEAWNVEC